MGTLVILGTIGTAKPETPTSLAVLRYRALPRDIVRAMRRARTHRPGYLHGGANEGKASHFSALSSQPATLRERVTRGLHYLDAALKAGR